MANSLLDFVIALVSDPDAAARYAADPAKALADAHLAGVTSVDVNNLIPMVSDNLSMTGSGAGLGSAPPGITPADHGNVWASGAAAAALDAFSPHTPAGVVVEQHPTAGVIAQPPAPEPVPAPSQPQPVGLESHAPSALFTEAAAPESVVDHGGFPVHDANVWDHLADHPHPGDAGHHGFGIHG